MHSDARSTLVVHFDAIPDPFHWYHDDARAELAAEQALTKCMGFIVHRLKTVIRDSCMRPCWRLLVKEPECLRSQTLIFRTRNVESCLHRVLPRLILRQAKVISLVYGSLLCVGRESFPTLPVLYLDLQG